MKIDKDLSLLFVLSASFIFEGSDNETAIEALKQLLVKYNIDLDSIMPEFEDTEENTVKWLEYTIDRIQETIDRMNDLEY